MRNNWLPGWVFSEMPEAPCLSDQRVAELYPADWGQSMFAGAAKNKIKKFLIASSCECHSEVNVNTRITELQQCLLAAVLSLE